MNIQIQNIGPIVERLKKRCSTMPGAIDRAAARTVNKVAKSTRTEAGRLIRQEISLKARDVTKAFTIHRGTPAHPVAVLSASAKKGVGLDYYPVRPGASSRKRPAKGITVKIKKREPYKRVQGAFWGTAKNGRRMLFKRKGAKRLPVRRLYGPSMMTFYRRKSFQRRLARRTSDRLLHVFTQELNYELRRK